MSKTKNDLGDADKNRPGLSAAVPSATSATIPIATQGRDLDDEADWYDDGPEEVVIGYECLGCGYTQDRDDYGGRCKMCESLSLEPMYY